MAYRAGCAIEVDGEQLILKYYGTTIAKGTPEKLSKKLEKLLDLKKINPNVRYAFIGTRKLNDLIALRKTHKSLFNANIATMWVKIVEVGKPPRILEFKAQSGKRNQIGGSHKAKERYKNEIDNHLDNEGKPSWNDSENKMIRDLQDNHLNFKEGLNIENIKIEIELYSIYHPCSRCQEVISQFQKYYNAKIKVYSTELRGNTDFIKKYPNLSTKNN